MTGDTTPQNQAHALLAENFRWLMDIRPLVLTGIVDCLADAGLLCSSPVVQPKDEDGSLRSEPSALGEDSAVYVRLSNRAVNETVSHCEGTVNVDMDDYDEPVGVEILGAVQVAIDGRVVGLEYE